MKRVVRITLEQRDEETDMLFRLTERIDNVDELPDADKAVAMKFNWMTEKFESAIALAHKKNEKGK
jgi:hypothetical protein